MSPGYPAPQRKSATIRLLFAANVILLVAPWVVSLYGYGRLPQEVSSWLGLWKSDQPLVERSLAFFTYPISQVFLFFIILSLAKAFFLKAHEPGKDGQPLEAEKTLRLLDLDKEVVYLALIFFNLIFIHLQTSLILLSHQIGAGINKYYFVTLIVMIIFILLPYRNIRRKMIRTERG